MRILWLNAGLLLPLDKGGKLRTYHLVRSLARQHQVTYLSFADPDPPARDIAGMREICAELVTVPRAEASKGTFRFYAGAAGTLADPAPYALAKYRCPEYAAEVRRLLHSGRFDLVVCDFLTPFLNMPEHRPCPGVLFTHNVESELWRRHVETQPDPVRRALFAMQWKRMLRAEAAALRSFDLVLAVSETDRDTLSRIYPRDLRAPVHVVPTGVDATYFAPTTHPAADPHRLVFTGSMDWLPNEDGMRWFCERVLPLVRAEEPRVRLDIVGRSPTPAVRRLGDEPGVRVTGTVADVRPHVAEAAVYVVPLRIGGGTRLKIFEAMAMGKAIVSTTVGAEGLPVRDGRDIVLADDPERFARSVVELLRDPGRRQRIGREARSLVVDRYDWATVATGMDEALVRTAAAPRGRSSLDLRWEAEERARRAGGPRATETR